MDELDRWGIVELGVDLARRGEEFAMATVVWRHGPTSGQAGSRAIVTASGELHGWIGGACAEPVLIREAQRALTDREPRLLVLGPPDQLGDVPHGITAIAVSCQSEGAMQIYLEPVLATPHLVIVGRSPMANTLSQLARALDWLVDLVDGADFTPEHVDSRSIVVIATQGHGDEAILARALSVRPVYLGVVASKRRGDVLRRHLADCSFDAATIARVRVPVGLDLGHTTHREVAVALLAELVQLRAAGELSPAEAAAPAAAARRPATQQPVDPVCGMTVEVTANTPSCEHDGGRYHFCCAGCRTTFAANPSGYVSAGAPC